MPGIPLKNETKINFYNILKRVRGRVIFLNGNIVIFEALYIYNIYVSVNLTERQILCIVSIYLAFIVNTAAGIE